MAQFLIWYAVQSTTLNGSTVHEDGKLPVRLYIFIIKQYAETQRPNTKSYDFVHTYADNALLQS